MGGTWKDRIPRPLTAPHEAPHEGWFGDCRYHLYHYDPAMMRGRRIGWCRARSRALTWLRAQPEQLGTHEAWIVDTRDNSRTHREGRFVRQINIAITRGSK